LRSACALVSRRGAEKANLVGGALSDHQAVRTAIGSVKRGCHVYDSLKLKWPRRAEPEKEKASKGLANLVNA
jgi:hypothetical protein